MYKEKEFKEDLKILLKKAGNENLNMMFLFSDTQIISESFLEDINNILNTGEVPNLWGNDDIENIQSELRQAAKADGKETKIQILQFFVQRCRDNLHIVLTFSPVGEQFRNRCRQFPSIINCCTIDWYNPWPSEALFSVAQKSYTGNEKLINPDYCEKLSNMSVEIHNSVTEASDECYIELKRKNYSTPKSYIDLIAVYIEMLKNLKATLPFKIRRYKNGLKKMQQVNEDVDKLKENLILLGPKIDKKEAETKAMVKDIEKKQIVATEQEKVCEKESQEAQVLFDQVREISEACAKDLEEAMPMYRSAQSALKTLNVKDIIEMKSYPKPPTELVTLISAVCLLMGSKENWDE